MSTEREGRERSSPRLLAAAWSGVLMGAIAAGALGVLAVAAWRHPAEPGFAGVSTGDYCSVLLVNGQVYYGLLKDVKAGHVRLSDVYYVQTVTRADGQRDNKLVNRQRNDWHSPIWQAIPTDKIVMLEAIGPESAVARLIQQDRAAATGK